MWYSVHAGLRVLGQAQHDRLGPRPHRERLDRADEGYRIQAIRRARRRLGRAHRRPMAVEAPPELLGIHTNMPGAVPPEIDKAAFTGAPAPDGLPAEEKKAYDQLAFFYTLDLAYAQEMGTRPRRCTGSPIHRSAWPHGSSTTMRAASSSSRGSSTESLRA